MDEDGFWGIIETADRESGTGMDEKSEALKRAIGRLPETEASGFSELFDEKMDRAYTYPLWGAAYIMHGGCSDDTFADFRACLISRGRPQFEHAVADPDSLADEAFDRDAWFYEGYQYAVADGVEAAAGSRPPCNRLANHGKSALMCSKVSIQESGHALAEAGRLQRSPARPGKPPGGSSGIRGQG